jgi:hypothetical protein
MGFDSRKLGELMIYISRRSADDPKFGKTKLMKLLAFTDFLAFGRTGEPVTGATYIKLDYGPVPREARDVMDGLERQGAVVSTAESSHGYSRSRLVAHREILPGILSDAELAIADEVIDHYWSWTSTALSEESHREFTGWRMVEDKETIPYSSVFLAADQTPSPQAVEYGQKVAAELGLLTA